MNKQKSRSITGWLKNLRIGQRLIIAIMFMITVLVLPIILVMTQALSHQRRYNRILENLGNISYIIQETENQGYRIIDYCTMSMNIDKSGETEIIVQMLDKADKIRKNIGTDKRYKKNQEMLQIVKNLLKNYAQSYKTGVIKCGKTFSMAGDTEFYSMVDTANYIVRNCNKLQSLEMNRSEDLKEEISDDFNRMFLTVFSIVVIVILVMILFVYSITKSITNPLGLLMSHIANISEDKIRKDILESNEEGIYDVSVSSRENESPKVRGKNYENDNEYEFARGEDLNSKDRLFIHDGPANESGVLDTDF